MRYLVQYSGGLGSFAAAIMCIARYGQENVELVFSDTKIEDEDLYTFIQQTVEFLGVKLHYLADGRDPWQVFHDENFLGNSRIDPCSKLLKREVCKRYVRATFPDTTQTTIVLGIDWTEEHRVKNFVRWWEPYPAIAPLVENTKFDKQKFIDLVREWGIIVPRLYTMGFPHNNCGGFCVKAGKAHFLHLLATMPERYDYHARKEAEFQQHIGKPYTILAEVKSFKSLGAAFEYSDQNPGSVVTHWVNGKFTRVPEGRLTLPARRYQVKRPVSLIELRSRAQEERQTEEGQLDWGGCGCFSAIPEEEFTNASAK